MDKLEMDVTEKHAVTTLLDKFEAEFAHMESDEALHRANLLAHELPPRIRLAMDAFRLERTSGVLRISGYEVDQERVGPTPAHWRECPRPSPTRREDLMLILLSSLLGDPFAWATQQDGRLIHDIIPIRGHEQEQLGSSSDALLTWHTEDAFHPLRGDFLSFACIRNPYAAATTIGYSDALNLPESVTSVLFEERFTILPDESHLAKNNSAPARATFQGVEEMQHNPTLVPVLFGDPADPYIRADPYFMRVAPDDHEAQAALDHFVKQMDENMVDLSLEAGEFCFIDNFRVVHGRKPFKARHDGTDRWLKRINVTRDLRKSRAQRPSSQERLIR
ncbi:guanitoxin biosynthesis L-enduracididine beta-hydroxylase GntD [Microbispora sp. NPDC046973]|uniref:guanitoxin biosynthesis L-enduracididine beta-hydroxylase GntD n=1 Tax=Microbispora sp. NPDC046973 TaxID=3155022 RepID=UPI0033E1137F